MSKRITVPEDGVETLFGSYDDDPPAPGLVSRYKNLLHHHVHQNGRPDASTFWAGCGAIRRGVLDILVDNSMLLQELEGFRKQELLAQLKEVVRHSTLTGLKFRKM